MPTSAAGSKRAPPRKVRAPVRSNGFTLLELLVVIAIIAIATAGVGLALRDSGQASLEREGDRLAALLESARAQSRASGATVRWRPTPQGPGAFAFDGLPPDALPSAWMSDGISAQAVAADGQPVVGLQLGPEPIIAAQQVLITSSAPPGRTLRIATDGLRPFAVVSP